MEVTTLLYWRVQGITELQPQPAFKRYDTAPEIAADFSASGTALSLLGSKVKARVRYTVSLLDPVTTSTTQLRTTYDARVRTGTVMKLRDELLLIKSADNVSEAGVLRISVSRGHQETTRASYPAGFAARVTLFERPCTLLKSTSNNRCYFTWESEDLSQAGGYELDYEVRDSTGKRFTAPLSPITFQVLDGPRSS